jgi:exonuclease SbcD
VHYSGAPLAVDFGEEENTPVVCLVEAGVSTPAVIHDIPIKSAKRLRTVIGTAAELKASATDYGDDYLRVYVREKARAGLREEVVEVLPNALEVRIHPDFLETGQRPRPRDTKSSPHDLFAEYCTEMQVDDADAIALFDELLDEIVGR